ncbi:hypothetical protein [Marinigracilibium pacificum]|uniref:CHRD domain-containing protein n=1 Tax=Marinigracilibium pacificum TaxID=2729599 RepID=A0A848ITY5_9BACT|nr:hypothetical protein [Marinigracilibium pacificum]NMM47953.1 hypothetical protein [Marinigracilibium pacificum]
MLFNKLISRLHYILMIVLIAGIAISCDDDDEDPVGPQPTGEEKVYTLYNTSFEAFGTVKFVELDDNSTRVIIDLNNDTGPHPGHIHMGSTFEPGQVVIDLNNVINGASTTEISEDNAGNDVTYDDLLAYDGYVALHVSESDLTVAATADIGPNELTGNIEDYPLFVPNSLTQIDGGIFFVEKVGGDVWVAVSASVGVAGMMHPMHIHDNSAAETGDVAITLNELNGDTDFSATLIQDRNFDNLSSFDGYVNIHLSVDDIGTIVAQGDIGSNALTGEVTQYTLEERNDSGVTGVVEIYKREGGHSLVMIDLVNTTQGTIYPVEIWSNSSIESGSKLIELNSINGSSGKGLNTIREDNSGDVTYAVLTSSYNANLRVYLPDETVAARTDIGGNALSGESTTYNFVAVDNSGIEGTATFKQRLNGYTLLEIQLTGTPDQGIHPAHIHSGSISNPGGIAINLNEVDGTSGNSRTTIRETNAQENITYETLTTTYEGYINVHLAPNALETVVTQTNIGGSAQ